MGLRQIPSYSSIEPCHKDGPEPFLHNVAERLLMYAVGRNLQYYDAPAVRAILRTAAPQRFTLASLVLGVVHSDPFRMRQKAER